MSDRKRKPTELGLAFQEEIAKKKSRATARAVNKDLKSKIDDLADLMAKTDMRLTEPAPAQMDVDEGGKRRRRRKITRKRRSTKRKH